MQKLPHWCVIDRFPALYDADSATAIEMTAKVYGAMNSLIDDYNAFVDRINAEIEAFETSSEKNYELFTVSMRQEFQDFIDTIELKVKSQDKKILDKFNVQDEYIEKRLTNQDTKIANSINTQNEIIADTVTYMKTELHATITALIAEMRENGELTQDILNAFDSLDTKVDNLTTYVTPEMFGAIGDGVVDDTTALQNAINYIMETGDTLKSSGHKIYCISQSLLIHGNKPFHIDFNYSTIKAIAQMDSVIEVNTVYGKDNGLNSRSVKNIIIECNELSKVGYTQTYSRRTFFNNFVIYNPQEIAIHIMKGGMFISDCILNRTLYNYHSTGILIDAGATDSKINNVYMRDMKIAVEDNGGSTFYRNVHPWIIKPSELNGSIAFKLTTAVNLHMCYIDTYETAFYCANKSTVTINQCWFYLNMNFYNTEVADIPVIFYCENDYSTKYLRIINCDFNYDSYYEKTNTAIKFSNKTGPEISTPNFYNLEYENYFNTEIYTNVPICAYDYYKFSVAGSTQTCEQRIFSKNGLLDINIHLTKETPYTDVNLNPYGIGSFNRYISPTTEMGEGTFILPCVTSDGTSYFNDFLLFTNESYDRCSVKLISSHVGVNEIWLKTVIGLQRGLLAYRV